MFRNHSGLYGQRWSRLSSCGRYAVRSTPPEFTALFIPGLWASAEEIGTRPTQQAAEEFCDKHSQKPLTIKRIAYLAKGVTS